VDKQPAKVDNATLYVSGASYAKYEQSPSDIPFSNGHVIGLTVERCLKTSVPPTLPEGSVKLIGWSEVVPEGRVFLIAQSSIPCLKDVRMFVGDLPLQFVKGYRSVIVEFKGDLSVMEM